MKHHQHDLPAIYRITHLPSGKVYIGQTRSIRVRWVSHRSALRRGVHKNAPLQEAWNSGSPEDFVWDIVCIPTGPHDPEDMTMLEIEVLKSYTDTFNLMVPVQAYLGASEATRAKLSAQRLEMWADPEFREKRVAGIRAMQEDPEYRETHRQAMVAFYATEEGQEIRSRVGKANWENPETREKLMASRAVMWDDPEYRAKQEVSRKKAWEDPVKRANRSKGLEKSWARLTPEEHAARVEAATAKQRTPEGRAAAAERTRLSWEKRRAKKKAETEASPGPLFDDGEAVI